MNIHLVVYAVFLFGLVLFSNYVVNLLGHHHYEGAKKDVTPVFDLVHSFLPDIPEELLLNNLLPAAFFLFLATLPVANSGPILYTFFSKFFFVLLLRCITTIVTILPKYEKCHLSMDSPLQILNGGCYEKVFSSHTALVYIAIMCLYDAGYLSMGSGAALLGIELFLISLTRSHYSVDIILGLIISFFVYEGDYGVFQDV